MYYKDNSIGMRRKFRPFNTAFSFGDKTGTWNEKQLRRLADECLTGLKTGLKENQMKQRADAIVMAGLHSLERRLVYAPDISA